MNRRARSKVGRKPTAAERLAHDVRMAELFPDTAGHSTNVAPCVCCRQRGLELGPGPHGALTGWCTPCANKAWHADVSLAGDDPEANAWGFYGTHESDAAGGL
jgi:hypothetical protein